MPSARSLALAAAVRMVDRVHRNPAVVRTLSQPPGTARLADGDVLVVEVPDLTDRSHAILGHFANLAGRQLDQSVLALFGHQLRRPARRTHHLRALAGLELHVMNGGAGRNIFERQGVAHQDVGFWPTHHFLPDLEPVGLQDIALLAVGIAQQGDARRAVGIVLDGGYGRLDPDLVALEVNDAQLALVAAPDEAHGGVTRVAPAAGASLGLKQRLVGMLRCDVIVHQRSAIAQRLSGRSIGLDWHKSTLRCWLLFSVPLPSAAGSAPCDQAPGLEVLRVLRHLLARLQPYVRLFPVGTIPGELSSPAFLARIIRRANRADFHLENQLHGFFDLGLGRRLGDLENQGVLILLDVQALFGNHRALNDLVCGFHQATSAAFSCRVRRRGARAAFFWPSPGPAPSVAWRRRLEAEVLSETCSFS